MTTIPTDPPDFAAVVELARHAPSVHNTQPWRFELAPNVLTLHRDDDRRLPVLDPESRQATISCGAAIHLARLGLRAQGQEPRTDVVRADGTHLEVRISATSGTSPTPEELTLVQAARTRHTQRGRFDDRPVEPGTVRALREAAQSEGVWVRVLETAEEQVPLAVLLSRADEEERDDPAYQAELSEWTQRPAGSADGVPAEAGDLATGPRASDLTLRRFDGQSAELGISADEPPPAERPLVVVLGTEGDSPTDWLRAGQALSALLVRATAAGVQASPLGQVLDQPWARRRLAGELGVMGHPQMVLRLGYGQPGPETPRRAVDELLS